MKYMGLSCSYRFGRLGATSALLLFATCSSIAFGQESGGLLKIKNKTQAFQVAALEQTEALVTFHGQERSDSVKLSLKNESNKYITAFRVSEHKAQTTVSIDVDVVCWNRGIAPGTVHPIYLGRAPEDADDTPTVVIEAVVFDDRTSDGDPVVVAEIEAVRFAEKLQLTRIIDLIGDALAAPDADTSDALDRFKADVSALPVEDGVKEAVAKMSSGDRRVSDDTSGELIRGARSGLRNAKEWAQSLFQIEREHETSGSVETSPRGTLKRTREEYKRMVDRL
ncbi:MAG TPA: hypothetical protein VGV87_22765 [Blastocatellia bacterium]|jgi:hypothetical protein|nr:hypothetical protein [Blastocatellia bacterium]